MHGSEDLKGAFHESTHPFSRVEFETKLAERLQRHDTFGHFLPKFEGFHAIRLHTWHVQDAVIRLIVVSCGVDLRARIEDNLEKASIDCVAEQT